MLQHDALSDFNQTWSESKTDIELQKFYTCELKLNVINSSVTLSFNDLKGFNLGKMMCSIKPIKRQQQHNCHVTQFTKSMKKFDHNI